MSRRSRCGEPGSCAHGTPSLPPTLPGPDVVPGQLGLGHFGRFAIGLNDDLRRLLGVIWPAGDHFAPARLSHRALPRSMPGGLPPRFIRNIGDLGSYLDPINAIVMAMSVLITRRLLR